MTNDETEIQRVRVELIDQAKKYSSATLHETAGKTGALTSLIKPLSLKKNICGPAITVSSPPNDNIMLHYAIYAAQPGDVLVAEVSGGYESGYWGDVMTYAAIQRDISGLVIDGCVRDIEDIEDMDFSVFARGLCIRGTLKNGGGQINHPIKIKDVRVCPGDLVVGDRDGVVVLPQANVSEILDAAQQRVVTEERIKGELAKGKTIFQIYGW